MGAELFHSDGQTDMTQLIFAFRNFSNVPSSGLVVPGQHNFTLAFNRHIKSDLLSSLVFNIQSELLSPLVCFRIPVYFYNMCEWRTA